ncbi:MAG: GPR1/FUN34/YaaH family transporter [Coriobacteriales bacterium]|jgi:succinate-acetate transporter protein|nr:GPR1/FUN34/YaaH family transporter [Coriobacteriales bacterium]
MMEELQEAKVQAKEWANPTPAGLVALAVACFAFFALLSGKVEATAMPLVGCWLIGGFVVQLVVALMDLKGGNHAGGNTFLFFSAFFMLVGGLEMFLKYNGIAAGTPLDTRIDGYAWLVLTLVIYLWTPAFFKTFNILSLIVLALDVALPFVALVDLKILPANLTVIAAYALLTAGVLAIYLSAATVVNTAFGKKVYPVLEKRFGSKKRAESENHAESKPLPNQI